MAGLDTNLPASETSAPSESSAVSTETTPSSTSTSTSTSTSATPTTTSTPPTSPSASSPGSSASTTASTSKPNGSSSSGSSSSSSSSSTSSGASSSSGSPTLTLSSTLTAPMTTSVQETVMSTGTDGQVYTTVIETATVLSAGSVVTSAASSNDNNNNIASSSKSNTGEIVGGVIGGVGGLAIIVAVLFFIMKRQQRRKRLEEAFDGNFDPDRIVRTGGGGVGSIGGSAGLRDSMTETSETGGYAYAYAGGEKAKMKKAARRASRALEKDLSNDSREGTLPDIPVDGRSSSDRPMQQLANTNVVTSRNNLLDEEGMDDEPTGASTPTTPSRTPPPFFDRSPPGTPHIPSPGPYGSSFPLLGSASSDGHGGMGGGPLPNNGRPPSMTMSSSTHGHVAYGPIPGYGYNRPPSFHGYNNSPYGGMGSPSPPGSPPPSSYNLPPGAGYGPGPVPGYSGMQIQQGQGPGPGLGRAPSPGASAAYAGYGHGPSGYGSNATRRYSGGIPMEAYQNNNGSGGGPDTPNAKRMSATRPAAQTLAVVNPS